MLEQIGSSVRFSSFYVESKIGKTGLTVTVDVYRNASIIVSGESANEVGGGIYSYTLSSSYVTVEGIYTCIFKTATSSVDQMQIASVCFVGTAGVENSVDPWTLPVRTLTQSAASIISTVEGSDITVERGDTLVATITGLGDISDRTKLWFTAKTDVSKADSTSTIQIEETDGLLFIVGTAGTSGNGSIVVNNEVTGSITITLKAVETAKLSHRSCEYDIQVLRTGGVVQTISNGELYVSVDVTNSIS